MFDYWLFYQILQHDRRAHNKMLKIKDSYIVANVQQYEANPNAISHHSSAFSKSNRNRPLLKFLPGSLAIIWLNSRNHHT